MIAVVSGRTISAASPARRRRDLHVPAHRTDVSLHHIHADAAATSITTGATTATAASMRDAGASFAVDFARSPPMAIVIVAATPLGSRSRSARARGAGPSSSWRRPPTRSARRQDRSDLRAREDELAGLRVAHVLGPGLTQPGFQRETRATALSMESRDQDRRHERRARATLPARHEERKGLA